MTFEGGSVPATRSIQPALTATVDNQSAMTVPCNDSGLGSLSLDQRAKALRLLEGMLEAQDTMRKLAESYLSEFEESTIPDNYLSLFRSLYGSLRGSQNGQTSVGSSGKRTQQLFPQAPNNTKKRIRLTADDKRYVHQLLGQEYGQKAKEWIQSWTVTAIISDSEYAVQPRRRGIQGTKLPCKRFTLTYFKAGVKVGAISISPATKGSNGKLLRPKTLTEYLFPDPLKIETWPLWKKRAALSIPESTSSGLQVELLTQLTLLTKPCVTMWEDKYLKTIPSDPIGAEQEPEGTFEQEEAHDDETDDEDYVDNKTDDGDYETDNEEA